MKSMEKYNLVLQSMLGSQIFQNTFIVWNHSFKILIKDGNKKIFNNLMNLVFNEPKFSCSILLDRINEQQWIWAIHAII